MHFKRNYYIIYTNLIINLNYLFVKAYLILIDLCLLMFGRAKKSKPISKFGQIIFDSYRISHEFPHKFFFTFNYIFWSNLFSDDQSISDSRSESSKIELRCYQSTDHIPDINNISDTADSCRNKFYILWPSIINYQFFFFKFNIYYINAGDYSVFNYAE